MSFDNEAFLDWLEERDDYYIEVERVKEAWPSFYDEYTITGITMRQNKETGKLEVPVRDYEDIVRRGYPQD